MKAPLIEGQNPASGASEPALRDGDGAPGLQGLQGGPAATALQPRAGLPPVMKPAMSADWVRQCDATTGRRMCGVWPAAAVPSTWRRPGTGLPVGWLFFFVA